MRRAVTTKRFTGDAPRHRAQRSRDRAAISEGVDDRDGDGYGVDELPPSRWVPGEGARFGPRPGADPAFPRMICGACGRLVPSTAEDNWALRKPRRHACDPELFGAEWRYWYWYD
ncbi:MAG: hypothetical protein JNK05_12595 [Myxococcales bacterium]|nr:hypothetical protein [Myxococcales bacterium]